jgi:hypothetical protein
MHHGQGVGLLICIALAFYTMLSMKLIILLNIHAVSLTVIS